MLAWSASFMFSLITTARLNDIDPKPGLPTSSPASPTSRRTASANSCRGTGCKTSQRFRPPERGPHRMGTVLQGTGTEVEWVWFPENALICMGSENVEGESVSGGMVGRNGAFGAFEACGSRLSYARALVQRSEEHTSELQSLMRISYAVFCLKKKKKNKIPT